jgi:hypothetical protein
LLPDGCKLSNGIGVVVLVVLVLVYFGLYNFGPHRDGDGTGQSSSSSSYKDIEDITDITEGLTHPLDPLDCDPVDESKGEIYPMLHDHEARIEHGNCII